MMSKVIRSTPAFLLRTVLAKSPSLRPCIACSCSGPDFRQVQCKQLQRLLYGDGVIDAPAVGRAGRHYLVKHEGDRSGRALDVWQPGVEELSRADHAHLLGHLLRRRDTLHHKGELVSRGPNRLESTHDSVAPVDGVVQFVAARSKAFLNLLPGPGDEGIDVGDRIRVADAGDPHV